MRGSESLSAFRTLSKRVASWLSAERIEVIAVACRRIFNDFESKTAWEKYAVKFWFFC